MTNFNASYLCGRQLSLCELSLLGLLDILAGLLLGKWGRVLDLLLNSLVQLITDCNWVAYLESLESLLLGNWGSVLDKLLARYLLAQELLGLECLLLWGKCALLLDDWGLGLDWCLQKLLGLLWGKCSLLDL